MAGRAVLELYHADPDGDVLPGQAITVTRPDGSPLGVALYSQPTGGSPVTTPITNSVGTRLLYANYSDLEAADATYRVVISYADAPGSEFADAFYPDPADLFVEGMTRNRSLAGSLTVNGARSTAGLTVAAGGAEKIAIGTHIQVPEGVKFGVGWNPTPPDILASFYDHGPYQYRQTVDLQSDNSSVTAQSDVSTLRVMAFQSAGDSYNRCIEPHMIATTGTATWPKLAIEATIQANYVGNGVDRLVGIRISNLGTLWGLATPKRIDTYLLVGGDQQGAELGFLYQDTHANGDATLFKVDKLGVAHSRGVRPLTTGTLDIGTTDGLLNWRSVNSYWLMLKQDNAPVAIAGTNKIWASTADGQVYIQNAAGTSRAVTGGSQSAIAQPFSGTTGSAGYGTITGGTVSLTGGTATTGGNLLAICTLCVSNSAAGNAMYLALALDGAAEVGEVVTIEPVLNAQVTQTVSWKFTGVAAGTHTVRARWRTSAGTSTAYSGQLLVIEEAH